MFLANFSAALLAPLLMFPAFDGNKDMSAMFSPTPVYAQVEQGSSWNNAWWNRDRDWSEQVARPHIDEVDPSEVSVGEDVTLIGSDFTEDSVVQFGRSEIGDVTVTDDGTELQFTLPASTTDRICYWNNRWCRDVERDITPGTYRVQVENDNRKSNTVLVEVVEEDDDSDTEPLSITSVDGDTKLAIGEEGTWTVNVEGTFEGDLEYSVKWGDEGMFRMFSAEESLTTQASATFTHIYYDEGTYEPEFTVTDSEGNTVSAEVSVEVAEEDDGMDDLLPVIDTIDPESAKAGSEIVINGEGFDANSRVIFSGTRASSTVESDTKIIATVPALSPGEYRVVVRDDDGRSNIVRFIIEAEEVKGRISVSGISAPSTLEVGEEGTWTVKAASNLDGNLMYSVVWGDEENGMMSRMSAETMTQSSATFTHVYHDEGAYKPKFTVTDEQGNTADVSASVVVEEVAE